MLSKLQQLSKNHPEEYIFVSSRSLGRTSINCKTLFETIKEKLVLEKDGYLLHGWCTAYSECRDIEVLATAAQTYLTACKMRINCGISRMRDRKKLLLI